MSPSEILHKLEYYGRTFPREALTAAIADKESVTPGLLKILEEAIADPERIRRKPNYIGHISAMLLLAQFREKRAYPLIIDFFLLGEVALDVTDDMVTEDLSSILASVSRGDTGPIKELAENESADEWVRNAALRALSCLVVADELAREEAIAYYKDLFHRWPRTPSPFWTAMVSNSSDLYPEEIYEEIVQAFEDGLVDESFLNLRFIDREMALGKEAVFAKLDRWGYRMVEDVFEEMAWLENAIRQEPYKAQKKVGRNDPCPCGSGKKYKKCCG